MIKKKIFGRSFKELTGCIHCHTEYSYDCDVPVKKIIDVAKKNNLDYITINDHYKLGILEDPNFLAEKELNIIPGVEINDKENNHHYLVFNSKEILKKKTVEEFVDFYKKRNAIGFIAHPREKRWSKHYRNFQWKSDEIMDVNGIEIWNFSSNWVRKLVSKFNGLFMVLFQKTVVRNPFKPNVDFWEKYQDAGKRVSAIGSVDAHSHIVKKWFLKFRILKHGNLFKTIRTNVLIPEDEEVNDQSILEALKNGNSYLINKRLGSFRTFYAGITKKDYKNAIFGEEIKFSEGLKFYFKAPNLLRVNLIRNGKKIDSVRDANGSFDIKKPGRYRIEIRRRFATWILSNYIYVVE